MIHYFSHKVKIQVAVVGLLMLFFNGYSQDSTYVEIEFFEINKVQWVNQIPPLQQDIKKQRKRWLKRLLFGNNDILGLQKPVLAIPVNAASSIILDQGNGTLYIYEEDKFEIPKIVRKREGKFTSLVSASLLPNKDLLFTDSKLDGIFKLTEDLKSIGLLNDSLKLKQPTGIAYSSLNNQIWVVETGAHQISILDIHGNRIKTIGQRGTGKGEFNFPTYIWIDNKGIAYVVDALNYRIQLFDSAGNFLSMFGENGNGTGYFASPKGIATDSHGNIYVVDALFHGVQIFDAQGNYLYQFGKQGRQTGEFWMPSGIYIDTNNFIYVADSYNSRIQIFQLDIKE
ncbi:6-bladed beta-propeller [Lutibacter sp.]|uniref:6-bladed beta-propeller n=1 Tax=Lutibacter sp. TaxID=1925666 RepID=UPI0035671893